MRGAALLGTAGAFGLFSNPAFAAASAMPGAAELLVGPESLLLPQPALVTSCTPEQMFALSSACPGADTSALASQTTQQINLHDHGDLDKGYEPMSLSKFMLFHVAYLKIKEMGISLDTSVTFQHEALRPGGLFLDFRTGETVPLRDLIAMAVLNSCNQSAEQLALFAFGSRGAARDAMNKAALDMGMIAANFETPSGMNPNGTGRITAKDSILMAETIDRFWLQKQDDFYLRLTSPDGIDLSRETSALLNLPGPLRGRSNRNPVSSQWNGDVIRVHSSGRDIVPDGFICLKTGTGRMGADGMRRHTIYVKRNSDPAKNVYGSILKCIPDDVAQRTRDIMVKVNAKRQASLPQPAPFAA